MITAAGLNVAKVALVDLDAFAAGGINQLVIWPAIVLAAAVFIGLRKLKWHPVIFLAISAVIGILFRF